MLCAYMLKSREAPLLLGFSLTQNTAVSPPAALQRKPSDTSITHLFFLTQPLCGSHPHLVFPTLTFKMALYDVEALLDSTATQDEKMEDAPAAQPTPTANGDDQPRTNGKDDATSDRRNRDKSRDRERDRDRDRSRDRKRRDRSRDRYSSRRGTPDSERTPRSEAGSHRSSRRRSRSRGDDRHARRSNRDGDYYRGGRGGGRSRSRSPGGRYYRPRDNRRDYRDRRDRRDDDRDAPRRGGRTPRTDRDRDEPTPAQLTEDERDRRTVFVQQLAARLRTKELKEFFEKVGPVSEAQIVKDRVSNRSKGYVQSACMWYLTNLLTIITGQCRLCGIQERRLCRCCATAYRSKAPRYPCYCPAYRS